MDFSWYIEHWFISSWVLCGMLSGLVVVFIFSKIDAGTPVQYRWHHSWLHWVGLCLSLIFGWVSAIVLGLGLFCVHVFVSDKKTEQCA